MARLSALILCGALALAGPASAARETPEIRLQKALAGRTAGKPVDCIPLTGNQQATIYDRTAIVYRVGSRLYLNRPSGGAGGLNGDDILVTRPAISSQLCRLDLVRLVDRTSGFPSGFVNLGPFVPYTRD